MDTDLPRKPNHKQKNEKKWKGNPTFTVKSWTDVLEGVAIVWSNRIVNEARLEEPEVIGEAKREHSDLCRRVWFESGTICWLKTRGATEDRTLKKFILKRERIGTRSIEDATRWRNGPTYIVMLAGPMGLFHLRTRLWYVAFSFSHTIGRSWPISGFLH